MTFKEIQDSVLRLLRDHSGHMRKASKEWINWILLDLASRGDWYWWHREAVLTTDSFYSAGRVSAKSDKLQLSGSAQAWSRFIPGAKISFSASAPSSTQNFYRVRNRISATKANLEAPFRGASITKKKYVLWRDEYRLRYDVDRVKMFRFLENPDKLVVYWDYELYDYDANPSRTGDPEIYRMIGVSDKAFYERGSSSAVANSKVITGNGTSFDVRMIGKAFRLAQESRDYEIGSAPSGSSLRLTEKYGGSNPGMQAYMIDPPGIPMIQLYPIPTKKYQLVYEYQKMPKLLYHNNDIPELPLKFHEILIHGAVYRGFMQGANVDPNILQTAKEQYFGLSEDRLRSRPHQEVDRPRRFDRWDYYQRPYYRGGRLPPTYGYRGFT